MKLLSTIAIVMVATLLLAVIPTEGEAEIYEDTLRLHILAASDSEEDQRIKLEIRDRVLSKYAEELSHYGSINEAEGAITALLPGIEEDVDVWLSELGCDDECEVTLGCEWYDTREYGDFSLPRGYYTSLRILIGGGGGRNWWCVMFPPMCLDIATEDAPADDAAIGYTDEEVKLISSRGYSIKFKLLELVSDAVSKLSKRG